MKKIVFFILISLFIFAVNCSMVKAQEQKALVQYTHSLEGKILATNFELSQPTIKVEYVKTDDYYDDETKEMTLRIDENTKITDESGKQIKKEELKTGNEVSVTYRIKWNFKRKPLWKIALTIAIKAKPGEPAYKK